MNHINTLERKEKIQSLVFMHLQDMTGKCAGKSKETCFKHFLSTGFDILSALADETMISNLEIYVCVYFIVLRSTQS